MRRMRARSRASRVSVGGPDPYRVSASDSMVSAVDGGILSAPRRPARPYSSDAFPSRQLTRREVISEY